MQQLSLPIAPDFSPHVGARKTCPRARGQLTRRSRRQPSRSCAFFSRPQNVRCLARASVPRFRFFHPAHMFDRYESELAHAFAAPRVQSTGSLQPRDALGHLSSHAQHQAVDSSHLVYSSHATLQSGISSPIPPLDPTEAHAPRAGSEVSSLRFSPLFLADRRRPALIQAPYVLPGLGPETQHSTSKSHSFSDLPDAFPASSDYPSSHHNVLTSEVSSLSFVSGPSTRLTGRYPLSATETPPPPPPPRSYEHVHHEPPSMLAPSGMQEVPSEPGAAPAPFHGDAAGEGYPVVNAFPER